MDTRSKAGCFSSLAPCTSQSQADPLTKRGCFLLSFIRYEVCRAYRITHNPFLIGADYRTTVGALGLTLVDLIPQTRLTIRSHPISLPLPHLTSSSSPSAPTGHLKKLRAWGPKPRMSIFFFCGLSFKPRDLSLSHALGGSATRGLCGRPSGLGREHTKYVLLGERGRRGLTKYVRAT